MTKWTDVIEAQRRWTDRLVRADGRARHAAQARPSAILGAYLRGLSALGKALVSLGLWLQRRYQPCPERVDGRVPMHH
jgi:hypothetical protein